MEPVERKLSISQLYVNLLAIEGPISLWYFKTNRNVTSVANPKQNNKRKLSPQSGYCNKYSTFKRHTKENYRLSVFYL